MALFSIVIPTKNRAKIVASALFSLMQQTFQDFEAIVVDNDDSDSTSKVIQAFKELKPSFTLHYIKTGGLSMAANWERGIQEANGKFLFVLEDKCILYEEALETAKLLIDQTNARALNWVHDGHIEPEFLPPFNEPADLHIEHRRKTTGKLIKLNSRTILQAYTISEWDSYYFALPRLICGVVEMELIKEIRNKYGRICPPVSPDVSAALLILNENIDIYLYDESLCSYGQRYSTGAACKLLPDAAQKFFDESEITLEDFFESMPIKCHTFSNGLFAQFEIIKKMTSGILSEFNVSMETIALLTLHDLNRFKVNGFEVEKQFEELERFKHDHRLEK